MSKLNISPLSRRRLLSGLSAGAALLRPWARGQFASAQPARGNFLFYFSPNGFYKREFGPTKTGRDYGLRPSMAALEPHKDDLIVIRGLTNKNGGESHEGKNRLLRCEEPSAGEGTSFDHKLVAF